MGADGEFVWDLKRWSGEHTPVESGSESKVQIARARMALAPWSWIESVNSQLFVHAIDFGFVTDQHVKRVMR